MKTSGLGSIIGWIGRWRAYAVGLVVWGVLWDWAGIDASDTSTTSGTEWFLTAAAFPAYFATVAVVRTLWPLRISWRDPRKLIGGGKTYRVHSFTGTSSSASRSITSTTTGTIGTVNHGSYSTIEGNIRTTHDALDQFFLTDSAGNQQAIQVKNAYVPVGEGQLMTAAWAILPGSRRGPYFMFVNHSTNLESYGSDTMWRIVFGGRIGLHVFWTTWAGFFLLLGGSGAGFAAMFVALACFAFASRAQVALFRNVTVRPLLKALREEGSAARAAAKTATVVAPAQAPAAEVVTPVPVPAPASVPAPPPPPEPEPTPPPTAPAAWLADPLGRHQHRYWDGSRWTEHVSDHGVQSVDQP